MAAENDILIKITCEADKDAAQKALKDLVSQAYDLEQHLKSLKKAEQEEIASIKSQAKNWEGNEKVLAEFQKRIDEIRAKYKPLILAKKEEIDTNKKSIKSLNDQIKTYKSLQGQSGRMVQQLRAMREELQRMEDAGEFGSQAFIDLSIAAGKLEDQIGDTQQRIRILASDTKEIDALMGLGDGLAGSFYIATSGAELFGGEMEGLQQAFYKVQAAMSILSGAQQVYNAVQKDSNLAVVFNTAVEKLQAKSKDKSTASLTRNTKAWIVNGAASSGASIKTIAHTVATKAATIAQAAFNAVIYANPIMLLVAGLAAATAGIIAFAKWNSKGAQAGREFNEANKKLEQTEAKMAIGAAQRAHDRQEQIKATSDAEENALASAKKRNASEVEIAAIKSKYAKQRADETAKYAEDEIKRNKILQAQAWVAMEAKREEAESYKEGSKKQKKALEELADAEQKYYDYVQKVSDLEHEATDAERASADAEQELAEARKQMRLDAQQANIDLMKEGAAKEIAQIEFNYREQMKKYQGQSAEEIAMRKALQEKMQKEIYEVRHKYQVQAQQLDIDIMRDGQAKEIAQINANYEEQMRQYAGNSEEEIAIRKALKEKQAQEIADVERKYAIEAQKTLTEIDVQAMEERTKVLKGNEGVEGQLKVWNDYYRAREYQLEENARLEIEEINRSTDNEEVKAARIKKIEQQYQADITALTREEAEKRIEISGQEVSALELAADKAAHALDHAQPGGKLDALKDNLDAQLALYSAQQDQIKAQYDAGLITYQDYKQQEWEIEKATIDAEVQYRQDAMQTIADGFEQALGYMQQISDMAFEAINNNIQAELDALDEEYTTDWEEAQANADKKYITEKEYEKKKADLEMKQAKYAKAQALTNIGIQTALAVMNAMATAPFPLNIAMATLAGAMGVAQFAIAASKPLAQYEKGRKGGPGEYALVGEKGPEIMYIPQGASIVPNDKINTPAAWAQFGVPELPHANPDTLRYASEQTSVGFSIDYDRLGASVAAALPKQRNVTVNVDRNGVHVSDGRNYHTYLNTKYNGSWN